MTVICMLSLRRGPTLSEPPRLPSPAARPMTSPRSGARPGRGGGIMPAVRTMITHSLVLVALATLPACQGWWDRRSRATVGDEVAIETRRLETVRLEGAPAGRSTALDLPAPRVRSFELLAAGK